jgi:hypothetical protein
MRSRGWVFTAAVLLGVSAGWLVALGFLAGQNEVETVRLLRDYLAWERQPMLRRRAEAIVRRMEATIV